MKRFCSILTFLFSGVYIAALFNLSGIINGFTYNGMYDDKYGYDLIMDLVNNIKDGFSFGVDTTLVPILVAAGALLAAITALIGLIGIFTKRGGAGGAGVFAILALIVNVGVLIVALAINKVETTGFGLYVFLAASVLMTIFGLLSKPKKGGSHGGPEPRGGYGAPGPRGGYAGPRGGYAGPRGGSYRRY